MNKVYEGGLPTDAGKNLFPSFASEEGMSQPSDSPDGIAYKNGGPAAMNANTGGDSFHDDSTYTSGMDERVNGSMKIVNPDNISNDGQGQGAGQK